MRLQDTPKTVVLRLVVRQNKMNSVGKFIAQIFGIFAVAVLFVTIRVEIGFFQRQGASGLDDWLIYIFPVVAPLVALITDIVVYRTLSRNASVHGAVWGLFVASNLFLIHPTLRLIFQYDTIAFDGTGYWALMFLPAFLIAMPGWLIGAFLGGSIGFWIKKREMKSRT